MNLDRVKECIEEIVRLIVDFKIKYDLSAELSRAETRIFETMTKQETGTQDVSDTIQAVEDVVAGLAEVFNDIAILADELDSEVFDLGMLDIE